MYIKYQEPSAEITKEEKEAFETAVLEMFNDPQNNIELISLCGNKKKIFLLCLMYLIL